MFRYEFSAIGEIGEKPFYVCYCDREYARVSQAMKEHQLPFQVRKTCMGTKKSEIFTFNQ